MSGNLNRYDSVLLDIITNKNWQGESLCFFCALYYGVHSNANYSMIEFYWLITICLQLYPQTRI